MCDLFSQNYLQIFSSALNRAEWRQRVETDGKLTSFPHDDSYRAYFDTVEEEILLLTVIGDVIDFEIFSDMCCQSKSTKWSGELFPKHVLA